jgi:hypothetical protein
VILELKQLLRYPRVSLRDPEAHHDLGHHGCFGILFPVIFLPERLNKTGPWSLLMGMTGEELGHLKVPVLVVRILLTNFTCDKTKD